MRILFTSLPASGHVNPLVPLAVALRDAGHDVAFAVSPSRCAGLERAGLRAQPAGINEDDPRIVQRIKTGRALNGLKPPWVIKEIFIGIYAELMLADLGGIMDRWRPDVVISDVAEYAAWIAAELRGIPRAMVLFGFYFGFHLMEVQGLASTLMDFRRRSTLAPETWLASLRAQPCLLFAPARYQFEKTPLPHNVHLFRPCVFDQDGPEGVPDWIRSRGDHKLVYATLGTAFNREKGVLEAAIQAVRDEDLDLVVTVGRDRDPQSLGPVPANVHVERYIPQSLLLPHCDCVISHSGYNTVMATLCSGLPAVLAPLGADQPFHAERCREMGVARVVSKSDLSRSRMRTAITGILGDPSYRARAQGLRSEIDRMPGLDKAVNLVERLGAQADPATGPVARVINCQWE
jgi:MGT family glycosyltransferase